MHGAVAVIVLALSAVTTATVQQATNGDLVRDILATLEQLRTSPLNRTVAETAINRANGTFIGIFNGISVELQRTSTPDKPANVSVIRYLLKQSTSVSSAALKLLQAPSAELLQQFTAEYGTDASSPTGPGKNDGFGEAVVEFVTCYQQDKCYRHLATTMNATLSALCTSAVSTLGKLSRLGPLKALGSKGIGAAAGDKSFSDNWIIAAVIQTSLITYVQLPLCAWASPAFGNAMATAKSHFDSTMFCFGLTTSWFDPPNPRKHYQTLTESYCRKPLHADKGIMDSADYANAKKRARSLADVGFFEFADKLESIYTSSTFQIFAVDFASRLASATFNSGEKPQLHPLVGPCLELIGQPLGVPELTDNVESVAKSIGHSMSSIDSLLNQQFVLNFQSIFGNLPSDATKGKLAEIQSAFEQASNHLADAVKQLDTVNALLASPRANERISVVGSHNMLALAMDWASFTKFPECLGAALHRIRKEELQTVSNVTSGLLKIGQAAFDDIGANLYSYGNAINGRAITYKTFLEEKLFGDHIPQIRNLAPGKIVDALQHTKVESALANLRAAMRKHQRTVTDDFYGFVQKRVTKILSAPTSYEDSSSGPTAGVATTLAAASTTAPGRLDG